MLFGQEWSSVKKDELGFKIRALRKGLGLTQDQLAERAGIDRSTLQRIEGAEISTSTDTLWAIGEALNKKLIIEFGQSKPSAAEIVTNAPDLFASIDRRLADLEARIRPRDEELVIENARLKRELAELKINIIIPPEIMIPPELLEAWPKAPAEVKAVCLFFLTRQKKHVEDLSDELVKKVLPTLRALGAAKGHR